MASYPPEAEGLAYWLRRFNALRREDIPREASAYYDPGYTLVVIERRLSAQEQRTMQLEADLARLEAMLDGALAETPYEGEV